MCNTIKRNSIFIEAMALTDSCAFAAGEAVANYKIDNGYWIAKDSNGKKWRNLLSNLRNENYYTIINQFSLSDIINYLLSRCADYQTVCIDFIVDAINTTFEEATVYTLDDIYNYISENLI